MQTDHFSFEYPQMKLTAIVEKSADGWYVGQISELPAALSQGSTIEELRENLLDALKLLMETNPTLSVHKL